MLTLTILDYENAGVWKFTEFPEPDTEEFSEFLEKNGISESNCNWIVCEISSPKELIQKEYDSCLRDYAEYTKGRAEVMQNNPDTDPKQILKDYDPDGDWENLAWEAGYLAGLVSAKNLFSN